MLDKKQPKHNSLKISVFQSGQLHNQSEALCIRFQNLEKYLMH